MSKRKKPNADSNNPPAKKAKAEKAVEASTKTKSPKKEKANNNVIANLMSSDQLNTTVTQWFTITYKQKKREETCKCLRTCHSFFCVR